MSQNNYVGHDQRDKSKRFVDDRLVYFGGKHEVVFENILVIDLRQLLIKSKGRLTYFKLSKAIHTKIKSNNSYLNNMINDKASVVANSFEIKDGFLYVCQVLASSQFDDKYTYQRGEDLSIKNKEQCFSCKRVQKKINSDKGYIGWYSVSNDSIYYHNLKNYYHGKRKKNNIRKVFSRKGTIAIDVIHHEQISCLGEPSYDRSLYNDGYYINSVSKSSLEQDMNPSPNLYKIYVGQLPAFVDTFYQVDLNYTKQKRPCMNNSIIYVNPDYLEPKEYFTLPRPTIQKSKELIIYDSAMVTIPFKRGKTHEDTLIFSSLLKVLDSVSEKKYTITKIYYTGVASIEGDEKSNLKLIKRRGTIIKQYLSGYYPNIEFENSFFENFQDFRDGASLIGYPEVAEMNDEQLRAWVNKNKDVPKVSELLNTTRQSVVTVNFKDVIPIENENYSMSVKHIQDLIEDNNSKDANLFYQVLAHNCMEGDSTILDSLLNLNIPENSDFKTLNWSDFVFRLNMTEDVVDEDRLNKLHDIGSIPSTVKFLEYRLLFNVFYSNDKLKTNDFGDVIKSTKRKGDIAWLEALDMISGVQNYRYESSMVAPILIQSVLQNKFDVYKTYFVCQYLIQWGYINEPYLLLSKFARQKKLFPKLYKQYIKLGYFLQLFEDKKEWKKIKIAINNLSASHPEEFCDLFKWNQMGVRALEKKEIANKFCEVCRD
jgi:hypothetical protein